MSVALKPCVFCGSTKKKTSEHVWGEWTKGYVERTANKHDHANVFVPRPGQPEPAKVRIRAGDHLDAQVRIVCSACNNGWLSRIQSDAKSTLVPLFEGAPYSLDQAAQQRVATWIAMATMAGEYLSLDPARIAIPQSDRTWLMENGVPPTGWCIWIGHYPREQNPTQWVKASFPIVNADELPPEAPKDPAPTMQTTAFSVGKLFAFAMSCHFPEIPLGWDWRTAPEARTLLKRVWPPNSKEIDWPPSPMSDAESQSISAAVVRYFEDFALRQKRR
jgi:hypothetical protein